VSSMRRVSVGGRAACWSGTSLIQAMTACQRLPCVHATGHSRCSGVELVRPMMAEYGWQGSSVQTGQAQMAHVRSVSGRGARKPISHNAKTKAIEAEGGARRAMGERRQMG
jgi:hypothetical protein